MEGCKEVEYINYSIQVRIASEPGFVLFRRRTKIFINLDFVMFVKFSRKLF